MYASLTDLQIRLGRTLTDDELSPTTMLLEDAGVMIDAIAPNASPEAKKVVSCRIVMRLISGDQDGYSYPPGASQGSQTALGYTQQWTMPSGGSFGELYLSKADRRLLGLGDQIGSYSPVEELAGGMCWHD